ncbi:Smr/MutS family protein [Ralstonia solanacearum]
MPCRHETRPSPASKLGLTDLAALRKQIKQETEQREAERQRAEAAARQAEAEANLFRASIGEVSALRQNKRVEHPRNPPAPDPVHSRAEEQTVLRDSLSDEFDIDNLLETDDTLSYRRPGIGDDVLKKLRRGEWATQDEIDLHGLRRDEAREALAAFLRRAVQRGIRCVRVVHGKGLGSPDKAPVLKGKVRSWLVQKEEVIAFVEPRSTAGGAGAVLVLLRQPHGS